MWYLADAFRAGMKTEEIHNLSGIDPWFLDNIAQIVTKEAELVAHHDRLAAKDDEFAQLLREAKQFGFSDRRVITSYSIHYTKLYELKSWMKRESAER